MIDLDDLRRRVIVPTLDYLATVDPGVNHSDAVTLLVRTAVVESVIGQTQYLAQRGGGPALGIYQMEPETYDDIWRTWLAYRPELARVTRELAGRVAGSPPAAKHVCGNWYLATAMTRWRYRRAPGAIPPASDIDAQGSYWLRHYNAGGAGTAAKWRAAVART